MVKTPKSLRLHIGIFGRRNVGKSSVLNALVNQRVSIISDIPGTTTDPVEKVMELKPIGPVVFIDTAGVDETDGLGLERVKQTMKVLDRTELAVLVTDEWQDYEKNLIELFNKSKTPYVVAANKFDLRPDNVLEDQLIHDDVTRVASTNAVTGQGIDELRQRIIEATPVEFLENRKIVGDLIEPNELVVLVTPIDIEAPKGRLKMLQVHCIREILDNHAMAVIVKETELKDIAGRFNQQPDMVICDSPVIDKVINIVAPNVRVTTFSILMARFKADLETTVRSVYAINSLKPDDRILIAEACTHHPIGNDIGREQIPKLLKKYTGCDLNIDVTSGRDFPEDLTRYKLIIHCGACVFNKKEMLSRIERANTAEIPITNYGLVFAYCHNHLDRTLAPFQKVEKYVHLASAG